MGTVDPVRRAAVLVLVLLAAACGDDRSDLTATSDGVTVPSRPPDITGTITTVTVPESAAEVCPPADALDPDDSSSDDEPRVCTPRDMEVLGTVLVEAEPAVDQGRKISFTVTTETTLTRGESPVQISDLASGQVVEAWSTGPCAESYPEQCRAEAVRRLA